MQQDSAMRVRDVPLDGHGPAYAQVYRALRDAILSGRAPAGTRLPATRELARDLTLSRTTILAAYDQLLAEGYAVARRGSGTFVAPQLPLERARPPRAPSGGAARGNGAAPDASPPQERLSRFGRALLEARPRRRYELALPERALPYDFRPCVPDLERLPSDGFRRTVARRAQHLPDGGFDYPDPSGSERLRHEIAAYLGRARGIACEPESIAIVSGVSQALDLAARLFVDPGDAVLIEDPGYLGARRCFEAHGARLVAGPVDEHGLDLERVDPAERAALRLAYVTPSHQFPTGAVMSLGRRLALLRHAEATGTFVVEDDYDSEFRYAGRAIEPLKSLDASGRVLYVGTFSKTLFPSLRIAYLVLPPGLVELFRDAKWLTDFASPALEQEALAEFLASGDFERHTRRAATLYGRSRAALLDGLRGELGVRARVHDSRAGLHVHVRLPGVPHEHFRALWIAARDRGVGLYSAGHCYLAPPACVELVFGFTRLGEEAIGEGIHRLAGVLDDLE